MFVSILPDDRPLAVAMLACASVFALACAAAPAEAAAGLPEPGQQLDAVPFGMAIPDTDGTAYGIRWAEPRKIRRVEVTFDESADLPAPADLQLQYWHHVWKGTPDPVMAERGAGGIGWDAIDDWTNGQWKTAETQVETQGRRWTFTFAPVGLAEFPDNPGPGVTYRKTLQVRLHADRPIPAPRLIRAYTDAIYQPLKVRIQFGTPADNTFAATGAETGGLEVFNGHLLTVRAPAASPVRISAHHRWTLAADGPGVIDADLLMAIDPMDRRYDHTVVTVRSSIRPFSFAADEIARGDRILVDDLGILVTRGDDPITLDAYRDALRRETAGQTVYHRITNESEQTLTRAWKDMPIKEPLYFIHGLPGNRNAIKHRPNGQLDVPSWSRFFHIQVSPRDCGRKLWEGEKISFDFGLPADHLRGGRELRDGYLPVLRTWWQDGPLYYEQTAVLDSLSGDLADIARDEPTVLLMRIRVAHTGEQQSATARLRFSANEGAGWDVYGAGRPGKLLLRGNRVVSPSVHGELLRYLFLDPDSGTVSEAGDDLAWSRELAPREAVTLRFLIPAITLTQEEEILPLTSRDLAADTERLCQFWAALTNAGAQIRTPEPWINDFYKAHARHLLINCMKELDSPVLHAHVSTFVYGTYPNESVMMTTDLDRRGYHDVARRCYDAFLRYQSTVPLPGNYTTAEGVFYGAGGHETGGYNKHHPYVCYGMADHWFMTGDREWMANAAPQLVKACDWIIEQRRTTMKPHGDGTRPLEYGWLPTGSLEDVTDYWHWLATNSASVWGLQALADALADFGHAEGPRLQREARAYFQDFMAGIDESRILCPVVRLRDGTYVPKIPSRLYERGRAHGWLRETLEGAMFLPAYGLLPPDAPETRWILEDYEDNLYISDRYGYALPTFDLWWFSRGGFSMQANLLDGPLPYLWRDEIKHFLRAYFNGFASAFYPEVRMCNEHSLPELGYPAGKHFKTSDEAQSTYWLRLMFINERGDDLYLGQAIPREWLATSTDVAIERAATRFGTLSLSLRADPDTAAIRAVFDPPRRRPPQTVYLRFRHPRQQPIQRVTVNGQPYDRFDADKEWVILDGNLTAPQEIVAHY